jgi:SAM-dependent methyltransferase
MLGPLLTADDADTFETSVVPRYLAYFGSLTAEMLLPCEPAQIAHLGCRTGYPDSVIADKVPHSALFGVDASVPAVELAQAKASLHSEMRATYQVGEALPTALPEGTFTHAFAVHPVCDADGRSKLLAEFRRVLLPGGQAILAIPLRGSFPELNDMIREFALRQDLADLSKAVDTAAASRPTIETVSEEFEDAGLTEVDVDVQLIAVSFSNGREFLDDPIAKLMVFPELRAILPMEEKIMAPCMRYLHDAISKYWSEGVFELTVNVGCASGRRLA